MQSSIHEIDGIKIVLAHLPGSHTATVQVLVKAGSIYEDKQTNGLAHFQEHMFFKGGLRYPDPQTVARAIDEFGGTFNAYTGEEYVGYYVTCADTFIHQAIDVISDMMINATFPEHEIAEEREVIMQELRMGQDNPNWLANIKWLRRYYGDNSYGWPTIGSQINIKERITRAKLLKYKQDLYTKDNMVIVVSGHLLHKKELLHEIAECFAGLPDHKRVTHPIFHHTPPRNHEHSFHHGTKSHHLIMGAKGYDMYDERRFTARLLATILGGNMSSMLFQELRENRGLCYYIWANHFESELHGVFKIGAGISKGKWKQGKSALYGILDRIAAGYITQEQLDLARGYLKGKAAMGAETSRQLASLVGPQALYFHKITSLEEIYQQYDNVQLADLKYVAKSLSRDHLYLHWVD